MMKRNPESKKEKVVPNQAAQIMRDRLNMLKSKESGSASRRVGAPATIRNQFQNTQLLTKSQKTRKGLRPG